MLNQIAILIIVIFLGGWIINYLLVQTFLSRFFKWIVRPGIIIHELSHFFACLITLTPVKSISLFAPNGGFVKHERSRVPIIGDIFISFAPIAGGFIALYFLSRFLLSDNSSLTRIDPLHPDINSLFSLPLADWHFWLFGYLLIVISATLAPSEQDIKNSFSALIVIGLILYFVQTTSAFSTLDRLINSAYSHIVSPMILAILLSGFIFLVDLIFLKRKFF